jgi:hypothetical protein
MFKKRSYTPFYNFSKTSFVRGIQCRKILFLDKYKSSLKTPPDADTRARFASGIEFEARYKSTFPGAVNMKERFKYTSPEYVEATSQLLGNEGEVTVFEAAIMYKDVLVLTDVLRKNADGTYDIFEVKHSDKVNTAIEWDLSVQYYVCKNALRNIRTFNLVNRVGEADFAVTDYKAFAEERLPEVERCLAEFRDVLQGLEPEVEMGPQCEEPYKCDFQNYCRQLKAFRNS